MDNTDSTTSNQPGAELSPGAQLPPGADLPPYDPPPIASPAQPQTGSSSSVKQTVATNNGELHAAETINIFNEARDQVKEYFPGSSARNRSYFKLAEMWRIREERQTEIAELFIADQSEIDRLRTLISQKRILILTGELRLGKTTTAIYLAHSIMKQAAAGPSEQKDAQQKPVEIYVVPAMNNNVMINVAEIYKNGKAQASRFVIFKDAFSGSNEDLKGFLRQFNELSLKEFANHLTDQNSYLIFTASSSEASQLKLSSLESSLRYELKSLNAELLVSGLRQRVKTLAANETFAPERLASLQTCANEQLIVSELKTMPEVVEFVQEYLLAVEQIELAEAIRRYNNIKDWFRHELEPDFESWCFALSLALAHWSGKFKYVSWFDFEYIRRLVWFCLRRDQELFPQKLGQSDSALGEISLKAPVLTDDIFETKSRARIFKDLNELGDQIGFRYEGYAQKLWPAMFTHYRRVLAILLERFCAAAQNSETDFDRRDFCAQIIGRIGEMDPERITLPVMNRWIYSGEVAQRAIVAGLYEGILASDSERYKQYFLDLLAALTANAAKGEKDRILTAIAIYARIGNYDPLLSMKGLERIVQRKLVPAIKDGQRVERLLQNTEQYFEKVQSVEDVKDLLQVREKLRNLAERIYSEQGSTFVGAQFALCSLVVTAGPMKIFRELRKWIEGSNRETGALIAMMFFFDGGIAAMLGTEKVQISEDGTDAKEPKTCSLILESLTKGREPIVEMARFLVTLYESFSQSFAYPRNFTRYLVESFMMQLTSWVEEAIEIKSCRKAMVELFIEMMRIRNRVLFDPLYKLLMSSRFLEKKPQLKEEFVDAVLWKKNGTRLLA